MGGCPLLSSTLALQELSRCALWLSARDHQGSRDPEEKSQHNRQTDTKQTDRQTKKKKKTGTECILIWKNGSWLTTANVNALSSLPSHGSLLLSKPPFEEASCVSPLLGSGGLGQRALGRSGTVDWLCLGPAQQRSCIASWGCGPSSRGPDLTIPPCGCHRTAMGSMLCPRGIRKGFCIWSLSQQVLGVK